MPDALSRSSTSAGMATGANSEELPPAVSAPTREAAVVSAPARAGSSPAESGDATILHVKVVDAGGQACTGGRLTGFWSEELEEIRPQTRDVHVVESEITGATTDVVLPPAAGAVLISASVPDAAPSRRELVAKLRSEEDPKARHGRVERDVTLTVGGMTASPRIVGRILVDGVPRVPRGLEITFPRKAELRIDAAASRYEIAPVDWLLKELTVTSDETVPRFVPTGFDSSHPPKEDEVLDLELSKGVTLRLNVLDYRSGEPVPGADLQLRVDSILRSSGVRTGCGFAHHLRTGPDGVALVTGLSRGGSFSIRRDGSLRAHLMEMLPDPTREITLPRDPLLTERIPIDAPDVLERTLRIDKDARQFHVFGELDPWFLTSRDPGESDTEVRFATPRDATDDWPRADGSSPWTRSLATVPPDEHGRFRFEVETGVDYRVWVEREHRRLSEVVAVRAEDADVGPVVLPPRAGTDVLLRLVRCPEQGFASIVVEDHGALSPLGRVIAVHGGTVERHLRLDQRTRVVVSYFKDRQRQTAIVHRDFEVDPATTSVLEVDLSGEGARRIELTLSVGELPNAVTLLLQRVEEGDKVNPVVGVQARLVDGVSADPIALEPGRYLYSLDVRSGSRAFVLGVAQVEKAPDDVPFEIRCELEAHSRAELGAGVDITEVSGLAPAAGGGVLRRLKFSDDPALEKADTIFLPKGAKFTVLEK